MKKAAKSPPPLAIGMPVYNGAAYLAEAIDALSAQTFKDFDLLICDNASTDRTVEIAESYANRDPRIRVQRNDRNVGATGNFRLVFQTTTAPLFKWASHDDLHEPDYLMRCVEKLHKFSDVVLAHSATEFIDGDGRHFPMNPVTGQFLDPITGIPQIPDSHSLGNHPGPTQRFWQVLSRARWGSHIFGVMRRGALEQTRVLADFSSSDRATLAELALLGRFESTSRPLYLKRFHAGGSWALDQRELKKFLGEGANYSRRYRQFEAFFNAARNKPVSLSTKAICRLMVLGHSALTIADIVRGKDAMIAAQGRQWRQRVDEASSTKEPA